MDTDGRVAKRQKLAKEVATEAGASRLFAPYRTIGLVSPTAIPFTSVPLGKTSFQITTSDGRSLQTYDLRRGLNLVFITRPQTPETITASAAWRDKVVAAWGGTERNSPRGVWVFRRGKKEAALELPHGHQQNVSAFCIFGSWIVGVCSTHLLVWKSTTYELHTTLHGISPVPFTNSISRLPTFLNKIIAGRHDGSAEIWNVSSGKLVYTILPPSTAYGAVSALEPTPALSLVAIAYEKGPMSIHDVKADQSLLHFRAPPGAPITSISFRSDELGAGEDGRQAGVMATASTAAGDITLWDLNNGGRKAGVLRAAHAHPPSGISGGGGGRGGGGIGKIEFLPGQSILVSSGLDNSLKTWIFDQTPFSPVPRILHERRGHGAPVSHLMFLPTSSDGSDDTGKWLLSSSRDRSLWGWSLRRDGQSTELSQGAVQKKAKKQGLLSRDGDPFENLKCPPITSIACCLNRDGGIGAIPGKHAIWQPAGKGKQVSAEVSAMTGWESVLTAHDSDSKARTWFWGRKRAGRWAFDTGDGGNVTSVAISPCGSFGLVGSEKGGIDMFNMQSGMHRQRFPARLTPLQAKQLALDVERHGLIEEDDGTKKFYRGQGKHGSAVVGLAMDSLNKTVVSAGADGRIKFWNFVNGLLKDQMDWSSSTGITGMRFHRSSDLAAVTCTDGCVRVIDISTQKLVRELWPSRKPAPGLEGVEMTDFTFSDDGRWIGACARQLVFIWDLPTGHLIDAFKLKGDCTSLAFSPTGEFLATATTDSVGVNIWSNRSLFTHIPTRLIGQDELARILRSSEIKMPTASGESGENLITTGVDRGSEEDDEGLVLVPPEKEVDQISSDLLTLSLVPRSRWQNLLHIDLIRQRNKPIEPPKKPEKAPFFLPSLEHRSAQNSSLLSASGIDAAELEKERTRMLKLSREGTRSQFTSLLHDAHSPTPHSSSSSSSSLSFEPLLEHLKSLPPAAADIEIRSLSSNSHDAAAPAEFSTFVRALTWQLQQKRDFELCQAWMAVFLRVHGDLVAADPELRETLHGFQTALAQEKSRVQSLSGFVAGMVGFLRAARV